MKQISIPDIDKKILSIKKQLNNLDDIRPGSLSKQYNVCGKAGCRCKDEKDPKKHGPYYNLSYTYKGRGTSEYIPEGYVGELKCRINNYMKMKTLIDEWIALSINKSKIEIKLLKKNKKR
ncbi:MAG: hypothetical protein GY870_07400 [archaeon]|nr:hypothetical protein [archaeon]